MKVAIIVLVLLVIILTIVIFILYAKFVILEHEHKTLKAIWEYDTKRYRKDIQHLHSRVNELITDLCAERRKNKKVEE